jgi:hypothetical protein
MRAPRQGRFNVLRMQNIRSTDRNVFHALTHALLRAEELIELLQVGEELSLGKVTV